MSNPSTETVLLDSNLLILLAVGLTSRAQIERHKRLAAFTEQDFDVLAGIVSNAAALICCPNVVTEASNLIGRSTSDLGRRFAQALQIIVAGAEESFVESHQAMKRTEYERLGVTDAVLLSLLETGATLYTMDLDLWGAAMGAGYQAVNFNHLLDLT